MLWQVTIASIGDRPGKGEPQQRRESYWMTKSVFGTPRLDLDRTRTTDRPIPQPVKPVSQSLDRFLALKTFLFQFLSFLTLRQGL